MRRPTEPFGLTQPKSTQPLAPAALLLLPGYWGPRGLSAKCAFVDLFLRNPRQSLAFRHLITVFPKLHTLVSQALALIEYTLCFICVRNARQSPISNIHAIVLSKARKGG